MLNFFRLLSTGPEREPRSKIVKRFYSDLTPVSSSAFNRQSLEEHCFKFHQWQTRKCVKEFLADLDGAQVFTHGQHTVTLRRTSHVSRYRFAVDINYGFGLHLSLLFTEAEAYDTLSIAKLLPKKICDAPPIFFDLPKELRERIYFFAVTEEHWRMEDAKNSAFNRYKFARCIGDPSGFYFPFNNELAILRVNRQMRQEALLLAYRRTTFHPCDWDDLLMLLVSVGQIGRDNIEAIEFPLESPMSSGRNWCVRVSTGDLTNLPSPHVMKCVRLLQQCKRLVTLTFYGIESRGRMTIDTFVPNPNITGIYSSRVMKGVENQENQDYGLPAPYELTKWLKEVVANSRKVKREGVDRVWREWMVGNEQSP